MNTQNLIKEFIELTGQKIGFMRAGIDDLMTEERHKKNHEVLTRLKEVEKELFPLLTERKVLEFNQTPARECDALYNKYHYSPEWIRIEDNTHEKDGLVNGTVTFGKRPTQ